MTMPFPAPGIVFGIPLAAAMLPGGTAGAQEYTLRMQTIFA